MGEIVTARDGRRLAVETWGPRDGWPVFLHHGTPGSRLGPRPQTRDLELRGIRLIAYDRPGYGGSDRLVEPDRKGRPIAHAASDVIAIADHLRIEAFSVVGRSGGGPHALACAALIPNRVKNAAVLVSLAPPDAHGLDWFAGMAPSNVRAFSHARVAHATPAMLQDELTGRLTALNGDAGRMIKNLEPELAAKDLRIVREIAVRDMLVENFRKAFVPEGPGSGAAVDHKLQYSTEGWFDDVVSLNMPWGFDVVDVKVPVLLWHGELDRFSPVEHFHWLADNIPTAVPVMAAGVAHFGAVPALTKILNWLTDPRNGRELEPAPESSWSRHPAARR